MMILPHPPKIPFTVSVYCQLIFRDSLIEALCLLPLCSEPPGPPQQHSRAHRGVPLLWWPRPYGSHGRLRGQWQPLKLVRQWEQLHPPRALLILHSDVFQWWVLHLNIPFKQVALVKWYFVATENEATTHGPTQEPCEILYIVLTLLEQFIDVIDYKNMSICITCVGTSQERLRTVKACTLPENKLQLRNLTHDPLKCEEV